MIFQFFNGTTVAILSKDADLKITGLHFANDKAAGGGSVAINTPQALQAGQIIADGGTPPTSGGFTLVIPFSQQGYIPLKMVLKKGNSITVSVNADCYATLFCE